MGSFADSGRPMVTPTDNDRTNGNGYYCCRDRRPRLSNICTRTTRCHLRASPHRDSSLRSRMTAVGTLRRISEFKRKMREIKHLKIPDVVGAITDRPPISTRAIYQIQNTRYLIDSSFADIHPYRHRCRNKQKSYVHPAPMPPPPHSRKPYVGIHL